MTIYEKTLYMQRLLYALGGIEKAWRGDKQTSDAIRYWRIEAENETDKAIDSLHQCLEIAGYMPKIKER